MEFILNKNADDSWNLTPTEGPFSGFIVAKVEGVNLHGVRFFDGKMIGALRAVWGLTVFEEGVYTDITTLKALCLGKPFDSNFEQAASMDSDGVRDSFTLRLLKGARRVMLLGQSIYMKGSY